MRFIFFFIAAWLFNGVSIAQSSFRFAHISDLHIGSGTAAEDLRRTVADINNNADIRFVIASGDITEFGSDTEIQLAKQIMDSLNKPWYIIPGNHDDNWSESGANSFNRIFGSDVFSFHYGGYYFIGANCGPNMKMSPGQVPYENIVWLDSVLNTIPVDAPVIFTDHYPLDSSLNNWYELVDRLKKRNVQLYLCGHGHQNQQLNFEGIPAIMGRSNLRAKDSIGGYNIVEIKDNHAYYRERKPGLSTGSAWADVKLYNHHFDKEQNQWSRPSYAINQQYPQVKELWRYQDASDIGNGFVLYNDHIITPNSKGMIYSINLVNKKTTWKFPTGGKIYSAPAIKKDRVVVPSTDGNIYCLHAQTGKMIWKFSTSKSIVATPVIFGNKVLVGSSEGKFRAIDLGTGKLIWEYAGVKNFVKSTPLVYKDMVVFGSWGNELYALDINTGKPRWVFYDGYTNRMLSPASCTPAAINDRVFMVAPDRYMTALDAQTGKLIWKKNWKEHWIRESMGLSADDRIIFAKCMQGHLVGVSTVADTAEVVWQTGNVFNYELNPSRIIERNNKVYAFSDKGVIAAFDRATGQTTWVHKIANCLVHDLQFLSNNTIVATTMDGKIVVLKEP